ncbi:cell wall-active antibiotics response protein [Corallococcus interemptor]|uniref:LiaF transmembrane domain-containing protein n=1 Tax=Corallococcus interemptor TaxID=2316720 RepID=UPI0035D45573
MSTAAPAPAPHRFGGRFIIALGFITLGVLFLLSQLGVGGLGWFLGTWWPLLLVVVAVGNLVSSGGRSLGALILLIVGVTLQFDALDWFSVNVWSVAWPVLIVAIGIRMLVEPRLRKQPASGAVASNTRTVVTGERASVVAIMAGRNERVLSKAWAGGEVTAVMGAAVLHLEGALPVEEGAHLRTTAVLGGIELFVPRHWEVAVHGTPLLGGIEDKRHPEIPAEGMPRPRLIIDATAVMAGVEIKDA